MLKLGIEECTAEVDIRTQPSDVSSALEKPHWYLIHCKPREDGRALEHLQRQGFECYRPMRTCERWRQGRKCTVTEALFPRYLFIHLNCVQDNWYPIRSTRGVHELVRFNQKPLPVGDDIIEGIRARLEARGFQEPYLKPGERVRIMDGAFSHLEAIFLAPDGDERVVLLMNILNKEQHLRFPVVSVRKVG
jgi:transcriptional antiterminator RfaH